MTDPTGETALRASRAA